MTGFFRAAILVLGSLQIMLSGCGSKGTAKESTQMRSQFSTTCIGVLPSGTTIDYDNNFSYDDAKSLSRGVAVMDRILLQQLGGQKDVRFVTTDQLAGLDDFVAEKPLARVQLAGKYLSCNAVLETTLHRYEDRNGGEYSADTPASVTFEYRLIAVTSGEVLCRGKFDETQRSVMENLYAWNKASSRGFTWISAEELLGEGLKERFSGCSYLSSE